MVLVFLTLVCRRGKTHVLRVLPVFRAQSQQAIQFDTLSFETRSEKYPVSIVDVHRNGELLEKSKFPKPFSTQILWRAMTIYFLITLFSFIAVNECEESRGKAVYLFVGVLYKSFEKECHERVHQPHPIPQQREFTMRHQVSSVLYKRRSWDDCPSDRTAYWRRRERLYYLLLARAIEQSKHRDNTNSVLGEHL